VLDHFEHPGAIAQDLLRGNRDRPLELGCRQPPTFVVVADGTIYQAARE